MSTHFNQLTPAEVERLALLIEDCGEVIQAATKILRHGYASTDPANEDHNGNRYDLGYESGQLLHNLERMEGCQDIDNDAVAAGYDSRKNMPYLHHQD